MNKRRARDKWRKGDGGGVKRWECVGEVKGWGGAQRWRRRVEQRKVKRGGRGREQRRRENRE